MNFTLAFKLATGFKTCFKAVLKTAAAVFLVIFFLFPLQIWADEPQEEQTNKLSGIEVIKPFDNNYRLNLYFNETFDSKALVQKVQNGLFSVYIPDTAAASKNIKIKYKGKVKPADVKIKIHELPETKERKARLELDVQTPVNSDIEITAQTAAKPVSADKSNKMLISISAAAALILALLSAVLLISICRSIKSMKSIPVNHTSFPAEFLNSPENYLKTSDSSEQKELSREKIENVQEEEMQDVSSKTAAEKSKSAAIDIPLPAADSETANQIAKLNLKQNEEIMSGSSELVMESVEDSMLNSSDEDFRPELISELKIGADKGFYLIASGAETYALFGYAAGSIFFLQKFANLRQVNLQARFYDRRSGRDIYIVTLDTYKAAVSVSDLEIKELTLL